MKYNYGTIFASNYIDKNDLISASAMMITAHAGKILIAEDERVIAWEVANMITDLGYEVSAITSSGEDAIQKTLEQKPDLILMDIKLDGKLDGIEAVREIHSQYPIPIIYLSAYSDKEITSRARSTRPFGYLDKPFLKSDLEIAIESALFKR